MLYVNKRPSYPRRDDHFGGFETKESEGCHDEAKDFLQCSRATLLEDSSSLVANVL